MFARSSVHYGASLAVVGAFLIKPSQILNEPKRRFYEDESDVIPVPGTITPSPGTEIEALGPNKLVDGISVRSTSTLESYFRAIRESAVQGINLVQHYMNQGYTKYNETERQVTDTMTELHYKPEDLLPSTLYIVIATMSGNIMARQRGLIAKTTFPLVLGLASFRYFLPQTFNNVSGFVWNLEKRALPDLTEQQQLALAKADQFVQGVEKSSQRNQKRLEDSANSLRKSIAQVTGLNIDEEVSKK